MTALQFSVGHMTCHHCHYSLSCEAFEDLLDAANGRCELCGIPNLRPWIDHDHHDFDGWSGVRGLVCAKCNAHLRRVDSGEREATGATTTYLARYEFRKELGRVEDEIWLPAMQKATHRQQSLSAVIRDALERYVEDQQ